jgi:hypothetical protein
VLTGISQHQKEEVAIFASMEPVVMLLLLLFIVNGKDPQSGARGIDLPFHVVGWRAALMHLPLQVTQLWPVQLSKQSC